MKVGDTLYLVYDDTRLSPHTVKIKSIGNKYVHVDFVCIYNDKFDKNTLRSADDRNGYNIKATLYKSKEDYERKQKETEFRMTLLLKIRENLGLQTTDTLITITDIMDINYKKI